MASEHDDDASKTRAATGERAARRRSAAYGRNVFAAYARFCGKRPWTCLAASLLVLWPLVGVRHANIKDNIRDGYTPLNAPSRTEVKAFRDFYDAKGPTERATRASG